MWNMVWIAAGDITNLHYNFAGAKPLVSNIAVIFIHDKIVAYS